MKIIDSDKNDNLRVFPDCLLTEKMAYENHGQTLKRLNERGGLSYAEMLLNVMGLCLFSFEDINKLPCKEIIEHLAITSDNIKIGENNE